MSARTSFYERVINDTYRTRAAGGLRSGNNPSTLPEPLGRPCVGRGAKGNPARQDCSFFTAAVVLMELGVPLVSAHDKRVPDVCVVERTARSPVIATLAAASTGVADLLHRGQSTCIEFFVRRRRCCRIHHHARHVGAPLRPCRAVGRRGGGAALPFPSPSFLFDTCQFRFVSVTCRVCADGAARRNADSSEGDLSDPRKEMERCDDRPCFSSS